MKEYHVCGLGNAIVDIFIEVSEEEFAQLGYVFGNPETGQTAIREALAFAKKHGTKVAVTCSEGFIVKEFSDAFCEALQQTDLLFCNETEACAVAGTISAEQAFRKLKDIVP